MQECENARMQECARNISKMIRKHVMKHSEMK
jgi:hypothetical protein